MKLEKFKDDAHFYTDITSEINRKIALAGIAIIWLFKITYPENNEKIPEALILPIILLTLSLFSDFMQYIYLSTVWTIFYRIKENKMMKSNKDEDIRANKWLSFVGYIFYYLKILLTISAYIMIFYFAFNKLI